MTTSEYYKQVGKTFRQLTITGAFTKYVGGMNRPHFNYQCSCGKTGTIIAYNAVSGKTVSCGCYVSKKNRELKSRTTHGMKNTPEYKAYVQAKIRCNNELSCDYHYYGGRGIKFLFTSFEEFFKELNHKPSSDHQLDRINNNGHYEIGNVRWATRSENCLNRRNSLKNKL